MGSDIGRVMVSQPPGQPVWFETILQLSLQKPNFSHYSKSMPKISYHNFMFWWIHWWPHANAFTIWLINSFTVSLHSPNMPLGLCKGTASGIYKPVEIPVGHVIPQCNGALGNPNLYLDQPVTKEWRHSQ